MLNIFMLSISLFFQYRERDFLRKSFAPLAKEKLKQHFQTSLSDFEFFFQYRERDLNPHSHHWPKDFLTTLTFT